VKAVDDLVDEDKPRCEELIGFTYFGVKDGTNGDDNDESGMNSESSGSIRQGCTINIYLRTP